MIIIIGNGRLGNQLFQYSFIQKEFPGEHVILIGFDELAELCETHNTLLIPRKYFGKIAYRFFQGFITLLGIIRLISSIRENPASSEFTLIRKYGIFSNIILIRNSFFQNKIFGNELPPNLKIKSKYKQKAELLINQIRKTHPNKELVFIHIRRGDYVEWPSTEYPAVLSAKWYFEGINYFKKRLIAPLFLVFTDDKPYAIDLFFGNEDIIIMKPENAATDLVLMSHCNFGILSASTFSWWAANFSRKRLNGELKFDFIGPKYWIGHSQCKWFPPDFYSKWVTYLPAN